MLNYHKSFKSFKYFVSTTKFRSLSSKLPQGCPTLLPLIYTAVQGFRFLQTNNGPQSTVDFIPQTDQLVLNQRYLKDKIGSHHEDKHTRPDLTKLSSFGFIVQNSYRANVTKYRIQSQKLKAKQRKIKSNKLRKEEVKDYELEMRFVMLLHSLHLCGLQEQQQHELTGFNLYCYKAIDDFLQTDHEYFPSLFQDNKEVQLNALKLLSFYQFGNISNHPVDEVLKLSHSIINTQVFQLVCNCLKSLMRSMANNSSSNSSDQLNFQLIMKYLQAVVSPTIQESCTILSTIPFFPPFITEDILKRQPTSINETSLLLSVYEDHLFGYKTSPMVLRNIVHALKRFQYTELPEFTKLIVKREKKLGKFGINEFLSFISEPCIPKMNDISFRKTVLECHKIVFSENSEIVNDLGYLSLALALLPFDVERAIRCYQMGRSNTENKKLSSREMQFCEWFTDYFPVGIKEHLLDLGSDDLKRLADSMWKPDVMNPPAKVDDDLKILLDTFRSGTIMASHELERIIDLLYKKPPHTSNVAVESREGYYHHHVTFEGFHTPQDLARYIYQTVPNPKPIGLTGKVLLGESSFPESHELMFDLYEKLLEDGMIPNSKCLSALFKTCINSSKSRGGGGNLVLKWKGIEAYKLAKAQFRKHSKLTPTPHTINNCNKIIVPESLWNDYIHVLAIQPTSSRNDVKSQQLELQTVFDIWINLKYVPSKRNLSMLIASLKFGEDLRERGMKHLQLMNYKRSDGNDMSDEKAWIWPDKYEVEKIRKWIFEY